MCLTNYSWSPVNIIIYVISRLPKLHHLSSKKAFFVHTPPWIYLSFPAEVPKLSSIPLTSRPNYMRDAIKCFSGTAVGTDSYSGPPMTPLFTQLPKWDSMQRVFVKDASGTSLGLCCLLFKRGNKEFVIITSPPQCIKCLFTKYFRECCHCAPDGCCQYGCVTRRLSQVNMKKRIVAASLLLFKQSVGRAKLLSASCAA